MVRKHVSPPAAIEALPTRIATRHTLSSEIPSFFCFQAIFLLNSGEKHGLRSRYLSGVFRSPACYHAVAL